jgi:hypothetical protein
MLAILVLCRKNLAKDGDSLVSFDVNGWLVRFQCDMKINGQQLVWRYSVAQ